MPPLNASTSDYLYIESERIYSRLRTDYSLLEMQIGQDDYDDRADRLYNDAKRSYRALCTVLEKADERAPPKPRHPEREIWHPRPKPSSRRPDDHGRNHDAGNRHNASRLAHCSKDRVAERYVSIGGRGYQRAERPLTEYELWLYRDMDFDDRHRHDKERALEALDRAKATQRELRDFLERRDRRLQREEEREQRERRRARERRNVRNSARANDDDLPPPYKSVETLPLYQEHAEGQLNEEHPDNSNQARRGNVETVAAGLQSLNL